MTAIYTLWARLPDDEGAWLIACEDEFCWEGDPDRCEAKFKDARAAAMRDGNEVREVILTVAQEDIEAAFRSREVEALVSNPEPPEPSRAEEPPHVSGSELPAPAPVSLSVQEGQTP